MDGQHLLDEIVIDDPKTTLARRDALRAMETEEDTDERGISHPVFFEEGSDHPAHLHAVRIALQMTGVGNKRRYRTHMMGGQLFPTAVA